MNSKERRFRRTWWIFFACSLGLSLILSVLSFEVLKLMRDEDVAFQERKLHLETTLHKSEKNYVEISNQNFAKEMELSDESSRYMRRTIWPASFLGFLVPLFAFGVWSWRACRGRPND